MDDCLFCKIIAGKIPGDKVFENDSYFAFNDINPQAPTHILLIPKKHISKISQMTGDDRELIGGLFKTAADICEEKGISDYRLVVNNGSGAGQTVFHIHLHLLAGRPMKWPPG